MADFELFKGKKFMKKQGSEFKEVDAQSVLKGKVVALYFSAHWCPPCKAFTPILRDLYEELSDEQFEVIFVSFDRTEEAQKEYMHELHGDWVTIPFGDPLIQDLGSKFQVSGIPALLIIKPDGSVVNPNARGDVQRKEKSPQQLLKDWKTQCGL